jgi:Cu+-exporting ATPase
VLQKVVAEPQAYLEPASPAAAEMATGTIWTCPMHPEIRQDHPGVCPICGMTLEPEIASVDSGPSSELRDMSRRFWVALVLSLPVFILEMGGHLFPAMHQWIPPHISTWVQFALATPVVLWAGKPFFVRGWTSVRLRSLNMFTLIVGTGVAWVYSVIGTFAPSLFPASFSRDGWVRRRLFRSRRRHHRACPVGSGARALRARARQARSRRCSIWRPRRRDG